MWDVWFDGQIVCDKLEHLSNIDEIHSIQIFDEKFSFTIQIFAWEYWNKHLNFFIIHPKNSEIDFTFTTQSSKTHRILWGLWPRSKFIYLKYYKNSSEYCQGILFLWVFGFFMSSWVKKCKISVHTIKLINKEVRKLSVLSLKCTVLGQNRLNVCN